MKPLPMILVTLCLLASANAEGDDPLAAATKELAARNFVDGEGVGFASSPGAFFAGSRLFIEKGTRAKFEKLLEHESPAVRAMGLFCLVQTRREKAVPVLRRYLGDGGRFEFLPYGCSSCRASVGTLAFALVLDRNFLHHDAEPEPLLPARELTALCLEVLSRDDCPDIRAYEARERGTTWSRIWRLSRSNLAELRKACPDVEPWRIIKGVGRLPGAQAFLTKSLEDKALPRRARLAAASALSRYPTEAVAELLRKHGAMLNGDDPTRPGRRILHAAALRRRQAKERKTYVDHPASLDGIAARLSWIGVAEGSSPKDPAPRDAAARALERLAGRLADHDDLWNTDADLLWRIRSVVADQTSKSRSCWPTLTTSEAARILRLVDTYLASRDG
jgi:hypothetical protein